MQQAVQQTSGPRQTTKIRAVLQKRAWLYVILLSCWFMPLSGALAQGLQISGKAFLVMRGSSTQMVVSGKGMGVQNDGILDASGIISANGFFHNTGVFTPNLSLVRLGDEGTLKGLINFYRLETLGAAYLGDDEISVSRELFLGGILYDFGPGYVFVRNTASLNNASATRFIMGTLRRASTPTVGSKSLFFPVGFDPAERVYRPFTLSFTQNATSTEVVEVDLVDPPSISPPPSLGSISPFKAWEVRAFTSGADITNPVAGLYVLPQDGVSISKARVAKTEAGAWNDLGGVGLAAIPGTLSSKAPFTVLGTFAVASEAPVISVAVANTGLSSSPIPAASLGRALFGFRITTDAPTTLQQFRLLTTSDPDVPIDDFRLFFSADNSFATLADNIEITGFSANTNSGEVHFTGVNRLIPTTGGTIFVVADIEDDVSSATPSIRFSLNQTNIGFSTGTVNPFSFNGPVYTFTGPPQMAITGNGTEIESGNSSISLANFTDFGSATLTPVVGQVTRTYTIRNTGESSLQLSGSSPFIQLSGSHASNFTIVTPPPATLAGGAEATFQIRFTPSITGFHNANVSLASNDPDTPFTFAIRGEGSDLPSVAFTGTTNVCQGSTLTLTATETGATYEWRRGGTIIGTNQILSIPSITAAQAGSNYSLTVTKASLSNTSNDFTISVNPIPVATFTGATTVCQGGTLSLTAIESGATYQWRRGATVIGTSATLTIGDITTASTAANYTLTVLKNGCSAVSAPFSVTVTPLASTAFTGATTVCQGGTLTLTATETGATYQWFRGATSLGTSPTLTISNMQAANAGANYSLRVTKDGCTATSADFSVAVTALPSVAFTGATTVCQGATLTLTATEVGAAYEWKKGSVVVSTNRILSIPNMGSAQAGNDYTLSVTRSGCTAISSNFTVQVTPLASTAFTGSTTVCQGGTLSLTATETGATYEWRRGSVVVGTNATLSIPSFTAANAGSDYTLRVTKTGCTAISAPFTVTMTPLPSIAFTGATTVCQGGALSLTATETGATYEWRKGATVVGTNAVLSIPNATAANGGNDYTLQVTKNGCSSTSAAFSVVVTPLPNTAFTGPTAGCLGADLLLTATETDADGWIWRKGTTILSTGGSLPLSNLTAAQAGNDYTLTVIQDGCQATSAPFSISTFALPSAAFTGPSSACQGGSLTLTASQTGTGTIYQWYKDNSLIGTEAALTLSNLLLSDASSVFRLEVINANGCRAVSANFSIGVTPLPLVEFSGATTVCQGETLQLSANETGATSYTWRRGSTVVGTSPNLSIPNMTAAQAGDYTLTVVKSGCTATSTPFPVAVTPLPVATFTGATTVCQNGTLTLAANAAGASYEWLRAGAVIGTSPTLTITGVALTDAGNNYQLRVSNGGCTATSANFSVVVTPLPTVTFTGNTTVCAGQSLTLSASEVSAVYEWKRGTVTVGTARTLTLPNMTAAQAGNYTLTVTKNNCTAISPAFPVAVTPLPVVTFTGNTTVCAGQPLVLTATETGASYVWRRGSMIVGSERELNIANMAAAQAGNYTLTVTKNSCSLTSEAFAVVVRPLPSVAFTGATTVCLTQTLTLTATEATATTYQWRRGTTVVGNGRILSVANVAAAQAGTYTLTVEKDGCTATSTPFEVQVTPLPSTTFSGETVVCAGSALSLQADEENANYVWRRGTGLNSVQISTSRTLNIPNMTTAQEGIYTLTVLKNGCENTSANFTVSVTPLPLVTFSGERTVCTGQPLELIAAEDGATYEWLRGNTVVGTSRTFSIAAAQSADAGTDYRLRVTKNQCTAVSLSFAVVVQPLPSVAFTGETSICAGQRLYLTATESLSGVLYSWRRGTTEVSNQRTFTLPAATIEQSGDNYTLTVTRNGCPVVSEPFVVQIKALPIVTFTGTTTLCAGQRLQLTANEPSGTYIWRRGTTELGRAATLSIENMGAAQAGTYTLTVAKDGCTAVNTFSVVVNPLPQTTFTGSTTVCQGQELVLTAREADAAYTWRRGNAVIGNQQVLRIPNATAQLTGENYTLEVSRLGCVSTSAPFAVRVNPNPVATFTGTTTLCQGETLSLQATEEGATYSWRRGTLTVGTARALSIANATPNNSGTYTLHVTKNGCTTVSATFEVVVNPLPGVVFAGSRTVCQGGTLTLTANEVAGAVYTWRRGTAVVGNGQVLSLPNIQAIAAGTDYTLTVEASGCARTSAPFAIVVNPLPSAAFTGETTLCAGNTVRLTAQEASATWFWTKGADTLSRARILEIPDAEVENGGTYRLTVVRNGCQTVSEPITLTITPGTTTSFSGRTEVCFGETIRLVADETEGSEYEWVRGNTVIGTGRILELRETTTALNGTNYQLRLLKNSCRALSQPFRITMRPAISSAFTGSTSVCVGRPLFLEATEQGAIYRWKRGGRVIKDGQALIFPTAEMAMTGTDYVLEVEKNGCVVRQPFAISVIDLNEKPLISGPVLACTRSAGMVYRITNGQASRYRWVVSGNGSIRSGQDTRQIVVDWGPGGLRGEVRAILGELESDCQVSSEILVVDVRPAPAPAIQGRNNVCIDATETYTTPLVGDHTYTWNVVGGTLLTGQGTGSITVRWNAPGAGRVSVTEVLGNNICTETHTRPLTVHPLPTGEILFDREVIINFLPTRFFVDTRSVLSNLSWEFGDGSTSAERAPMKAYDQPGEYHIKVLITDPNGCQTLLEKSIVVAERSPVTIMNVITPNGDGMNDGLFVENIEFFPDNQLTIMDRWGSIVFETSGYQNNMNWDATFRGKALPPGTYVCLLKIDRIGKTYKQAVSVMR